MDGTFSKKGQRLLHRHIQHIVNALALVFDVQCLSVIALASANLTRHIDIRQKCISILIMPSPPQASQRPPLTLKLNLPFYSLSLFASEVDANKSRIISNTPV